MHELAPETRHDPLQVKAECTEKKNRVSQVLCLLFYYYYYFLPVYKSSELRDEAIPGPAAGGDRYIYMCVIEAGENIPVDFRHCFEQFLAYIYIYIYRERVTYI